MFLLRRLTALTRAGDRSETSMVDNNGRQNASVKLLGAICRDEIKRTTKIVRFDRVSLLIVSVMKGIKRNNSGIRIGFAIGTLLRGLRVRRPGRATARAGTRDW